MKISMQLSTRCLFLFFAMLLMYFSNLSASNYKIDDNAVEQLFSASEDVTFTTHGLLQNDVVDSQVTQSENLQLIAGIVAFAELIFGVGILIPIHRIILGTGNQMGKVISLYCITLAGCGVITLVDGIMLLMDSEGSKYIDNPKFIMWQ